MKVKTYTLALVALLATTNHQSEVKAQSSEKFFPERSFSIRTNGLSWLALTTSIGLEYKPNKSTGLLFDASWTHWGSDHSRFVWRLWNISPQFRKYLGESKANYIGIQYTMGEYNITRKQGKYLGGGIVLGHQFYRSETFIIDAGVSLGYLHLTDKEEYSYINGDNHRTSCKTSSGYWGPTGANISFVWKIN